MPAAQHPVFKQPKDPGLSIWRYMDFTKFISMLESKSLFFSRSDNLGDPFEGSYSRGNELFRPVVYKDFYDKIKPEMLEKMNASKAEMAKWQRRWTFVNCWHMNAEESAGMWKLYAKTNEAIAVRSSFFRLANVLDEKTYIGTVEYIDFERDWLPEGNAFYPFVHKRRSFSHENEIRALVAEFPVNEQGIDFSAEPPAIGIEKSINLNELIEQIYIAPTAPEWFKTLVVQVCKRYELDKPIVQSALDAQPFY